MEKCPQNTDVREWATAIDVNAFVSYRCSLRTDWRRAALMRLPPPMAADLQSIGRITLAARLQGVASLNFAILFLCLCVKRPVRRGDLTQRRWR